MHREDSYIFNHIPSREELYQINNTIGSTQAIMKNVGNEIQKVGTDMQDFHQRMYREIAKKRKRKVGSRLVEGRDVFILMQEYDDGSQKSIQFFLNVVPKYEISILCFSQEIKAKSLVSIMFEDQNREVLFPYDNPSKEVIYQAFLDAEIIINPAIPETKAKAQLQNFLLPKIRYAKRNYIRSVPGWDSNYKFWTGWDLRFYLGARHFPDLPICNKLFPQYDPKSGGNDCYFKSLEFIKDVRMRSWIQIFPFLSLMSSVIFNLGGEKNFFLNIITENTSIIKKLISIMSIFNRHSQATFNLEGTQKNLVHHLQGYQDETTFWYANGTNRRDYNRERKIEVNVEDLLAYSSAKKQLPYPYARVVNVGLVIFSDYAVNSQNSVILYCDPEDFQDCNSINYNIFDEIYRRFLNFIERNKSLIQNEFSKKNVNSQFDNLMEWIIDILILFFSSRGTKYLEKMQAKSKADLISRLHGEYDFVDEVEIFRKIIRKKIQGISLYKISEKPVLSEFVAAYSEKYLLFTVHGLNKWMSEENIIQYKKRILSDLKHRGILMTSENFTYRFQCGGQRQDVYCIALDFFNHLGEIPIQDLGGKNNAHR